MGLSLGGGAGVDGWTTCGWRLSPRLPVVLGLLTSSLIIALCSLRFVDNILIHAGQTQRDPDCVATHLTCRPLSVIFILQFSLSKLSIKHRLLFLSFSISILQDPPD